MSDDRHLGRPGNEPAGTVPADGTEETEEVVDVLIVDDEGDVASTTAEILQRAGHRTAIASSLEEAVQVIASRTVRSVILDHQIADEKAEAFLDSEPTLPPVIVVSGVGRDVLADLELAHGSRLFACRHKPVPPGELIELVDAALAAGSATGS
ncbi:MAG TPA: response regulator [Acidimicrobiales bacterium]|nr:response regulator [Acidimicrobiales bacterium]